MCKVSGIIIQLITNSVVIYLFVIYFWPCSMAREILVPWQGIKPMSPAIGQQSLNHWTVREVLSGLSFSLEDALCITAFPYSEKIWVGSTILIKHVKGWIMHFLLIWLLTMVSQSHRFFLEGHVCQDIQAGDWFKVCNSFEFLPERSILVREIRHYSVEKRNLNFLRIERLTVVTYDCDTEDSFVMFFTISALKRTWNQTFSCFYCNFFT